MHSYNQNLYDQESNQHLGNRQGTSRQLASQLNPNSSSLPTPQFKIPEVEYLNQLDPSVNFKTETLKLIQANAILTELIKDTLIQKYNLTQKIIQVGEKIRRMQNPNAINISLNSSNQNIQQNNMNVSISMVSGVIGQNQK